MALGQPGAPHVVIVGGGVSGLSAAWYLRREAERRGAALELTVLEREPTAGGKIRTSRIEHPLGTFVVEAGADSFLVPSKPWAFDLSVELGMADRLIGTNDDARKVFVLHRGRLHPLPDGIFLIVPTRLGPFVRSGLLTPSGKLRTSLDLVLPRRKDDADETLAQFVTRRLGAQILDRIAEPLLSGIYNADAGRQSVLATLPRLRQLERDHRSLILAALAARRGMPAAAKGARGVALRDAPRREGPSASDRKDSGDAAGPAAAPVDPRPPRSMFVSYRNGMQELVDHLSGELGDDLRLRAEVGEISPRRDGGYAVHVPEATLNVDAVVLCTPAAESARLLRPLAPRAAERLSSIRSVSTGTVSFAYEGDVLPAAARGFGLVIPTSERRPVNAVTCSSVKFSGRAPAGSTLLRVFFGGSRSPHTFTLSDDEIVSLARRELAAVLGIRQVPQFWCLDRWPQAQPQYDVGHLDLIASIEEELPRGIWATGCAFRGVGIPDCARQASETATAVAATVL